MREIKFRAWTGEDMIFVHTLDIYPDSKFCRINRSVESHYEKWPLMQFTGLKDKNGKEIYEGDILRIRTPYRSDQTHYGDNIPLGSYTEPLEPAISTNIATVVFKNAMFTLDSDDDEYSFGLSIEIFKYDLETAKDLFIGHWGTYNSNRFSWDDPEEGDLQYLLDEYKLKDEADLLNYLGAEVIGNIHQNPELLIPPIKK